MENIFNPENKEKWESILGNKTAGISADKILCTAAATLILGTTLKIVGQHKIGSFIGSWAFPLFALGAYKKFSKSSEPENKNEETNTPSENNPENEQKENI